MGKGIELQEYLAHDAHGGDVLVGGDGVEVGSSLRDEVHNALGAVGKNGLGSHRQVFGTQILGFVGVASAYKVSVAAQTAHGTMVHLRDSIAKEQSRDDGGRIFHPWHVKGIGLVVIGIGRDAEGEQRHLFETVGIERPADKCRIVGGTALATGLTHHHSDLVGIVFPRA